MRIVLVNVVYNKGSTGKIVKELFDAYVKCGHEVLVIYGRGAKVKEKNVIKPTLEFESKLHHFFSKIFGNYLGGMFVSTSRIISAVRKFKPDLVHVHLLNGYYVNAYKLLKYLQKTNIKTILTMHAENMMTGGCGYAVNCKNYLNNHCLSCEQPSQIDGLFSNKAHKNLIRINNCIKRFNSSNIIITCVSPWLSRRYKESYIYKDLKVVSILNPVPDLFFETPGNNPYITDNNVLFVTSDFNDINKCGYYIYVICKKMSDHNFYVIDLKHSDNLDKNHSNLHFVNNCNSQSKLRDYYSYAKCTVLFSRQETFSMVVAESLSCKTPIVAFKNGGSESFAKDGASFVEFGDIDAMIKEINNCDSNRINEGICNFKSSVIAKEYLGLFKDF